MRMVCSPNASQNGWVLGVGLGIGLGIAVTI
jgi:hypothetical protein